MNQPAQHIFNLLDNEPERQCRAVDHDHGHPQRTGGIQLGARATAAGVLGDDVADGVLPQKQGITGKVKGPARQNDVAVGQGRRFFRRINKPQEIVVLRLVGKDAKVLLADCQKYTGRRFGQCRDSLRNVGHMRKTVTRYGMPFRALQGDQGNSRQRASGNGIATDLGGKGVCAVYQMSDGIVAQIGNHAFNPAKAANAGLQGLRHWGCGAPGIGKDGVQSGRSECLGHEAGFGGAAQQKDARHG